MIRKSLQRGFTLIELMVVVVIIGVLSAIAIPAYMDYVTRSRITEGVEVLADIRIRMEQWFQDNRTYVGDFATNTRYPCGTPGNTFTHASTSNFSFVCAADATTFTATANGTGKMLGFAYTVNESNTKTSTTSWGNSASCWVKRKGGGCT